MCPPGFTEYEGDVPGGGLTGGYAANSDKCADDCMLRNDCNSFAHSVIKKTCKLLAEKIPSTAKYQDYRFCRRDGK